MLASGDLYVAAVEPSDQLIRFRCRAEHRLDAGAGVVVSDAVSVTVIGTRKQIRLSFT